MAKTAANVPVTVVPGGDSCLNDARTKALCAQALKARPDAELIELDATSADQYAFDEAVSPSLLSDGCRGQTRQPAECRRKARRSFGDVHQAGRQGPERLQRDDLPARGGVKGARSSTNW